jgi:OOP family OmpA-OmpF porin
MFRDHPDRHYLFQFHYGGGFKYYLTQSLSLRGDLRHMISFENMDNDLVATIGVSYTFGTPAKKVPAQKGHLKKHEETVLPGTKDHATRKSEVHGTSDSDRNIQAKSETTTQDHIKPKEKVHDVQINQEPAHQEKLETKKPIKTKKQIVSKPVQQVATGSKTNTDRMASHKGYHKMQPKTLVSKQSDRELQMAYVDTDADGILDHVDKCPATPRNVRVNIFGCAPDHDRDGVIDVLDQCPDTPAKTKVDKMGCRITVIKKPQKHVVNLPEKRQTWRTTIQFDYKSAQIKSVYHANLLSITQWMKKISDPVIIINSHTDNIGSQIYNINLSDKRADSLKKYLHEQFQTPEHLIKTFSFGETQPVADNATEEGRQKNRRAEIVVTDNKH